MCTHMTPEKATSTGLTSRHSKFANMFGRHTCYFWLAPATFSVMYEDKLKEMFDLSIQTNYFIVSTEAELKRVRKLIQYPHPTKDKWGIKITITTISQADKLQRILLSKEFNWEFCVLLVSASNYRMYLRFNKLISLLLKRKLSCYTMSCSFLNKDDIEPLARSFYKDIEKPALVHLLSIRNNAELVYDCLRACSEHEVLTLDIVSPFKDTSASLNKYITTLMLGGLIPSKVRLSRFIKETSKLKLEYGFRGFRNRVVRQVKDIMNIKHLEVQGVISRHIEFDIDKIKAQYAYLGHMTNYKIKLCLRWSETTTLREITEIYTSLLLATGEEECLATWYNIATRTI